jgi:hypothetical protein
MIGWTGDLHEVAYTYDIQLTGAQFAIVPEPSSMLLIACAVLAISFARRRV